MGKIGTGRYYLKPWKAEKLPDGKAADAWVGTDCDQGLQVLIAFDDGDRIISYVWDTTAPVGPRPEEDYTVFGFGQLNRTTQHSYTTPPITPVRVILRSEESDR